MKNFSIDNALKFGWQGFKDNAGLFIIIGLFEISLTFTPNLIEFVIPETASSGIFMIVINVLYAIINMGITLGIIRIVLNIIDGHRGQLGDLFSCFRLVGRYLMATLLMVVPVGITAFFFLVVGMVAIGFNNYALVFLMLILFIPWIYVMIRWHYYDYFIVDKDAGIIESLKLSWELTEGQALNLFLFALLAIGINIVGIIALMVGLFVTIPLTAIANGHIYHQLRSQMPTSGISFSNIED
ncbi:MAG: hypothetical protein GY855_14000 [candidate division Zixibacteria bacterium]|nr:hypothetical protein [candidate division Zixibacteria bacterium]